MITKKANLKDTPKSLARIQADLITKSDQLADRLEADEITIDEWERLMGELIAAGTGRAFRAGKRGRVTADEMRPLTQFIEEQLSFLSNFADDIRANGWLPAYRSRAQMYMTATKTPYSLGDVIRQAGQALPLPSMPAEGTICHTNCKCEWDIVTIDRKKNNFDAYWRLGTNDNCQTCVQRAADWAPIKIRDGVLL